MTRELKLREIQFLEEVFARDKELQESLTERYEKVLTGSPSGSYLNPRVIRIPVYDHKKVRKFLNRAVYKGQYKYNYLETD